MLSAIEDIDLNRPLASQEALALSENLNLGSVVKGRQRSASTLHL